MERGFLISKKQQTQEVTMDGETPAATTPIGKYLRVCGEDTNCTAVLL